MSAASSPDTAADVYPLAPDGDDTRFTFGVALDVATVLEKHGFPAPASGADWVELQQALFRYIYVARSAR